MKPLQTALILCLLAVSQPVSAQTPPTRTEDVHFSAGATGTVLDGRITGEEYVLYKIGAEAGQTMDVNLTSDNGATYFNLYAPGSGPGDQALAAGEMQPEINHFSGTLPASGEYSISVFLYRNAARRNEAANYTLDISITGDTGAVVQGDFADGLQGGPDFFNVRTSGGTLNLRSAASSGAALVTQLANGTPVRNLGCRMAEGRRWCRVATLSGPAIEGWAAGDFLVEGSGEGVMTQLPDAIPVQPIGNDALVPGTDFHATGVIDCVRGVDAPDAQCDFGVTRDGMGGGAVTVFWPDGGTRIIYFEAGKPVGYDQSQADGDTPLTASMDSDNHIIFIGAERFVIPDAVVAGG